MKALFFSNLYPDATEAHRGIFNARLVKHLAKYCEVRVLSPRPVLPWSRGPQRQPRTEDSAFSPLYPRVFYVPKFGAWFNHRLMALNLKNSVQKLRSEYAFDTALGAWIYPDACALDILSQQFGFPFVALAQGSDVHQYITMPQRRRIILSALNRASAIVAVGHNLAGLMKEAGAPAAKLHVIFNGVETDVFKPGDSTLARKQLQLPLDSRIILYAGNFLPVKNPLLLLSAFSILAQQHPGSSATLVMVGDGPLKAAARRQVESAGLQGRVLLVGKKTAVEVAQYMRAANVLCLPSNDEGVPNVVLEAFATGMPVVATRVGGVPELLSQDEFGRLVAPKDPAQMADALHNVLSKTYDSERLRQHATRFSWDNAAQHYYQVLKESLPPSF